MAHGGRERCPNCHVQILCSLCSTIAPHVLCCSASGLVAHHAWRAPVPSRSRAMVACGRTPPTKGHETSSATVTVVVETFSKASSSFARVRGRPPHATAGANPSRPCRHPSSSLLFRRRWRGPPGKAYVVPAAVRPSLPIHAWLCAGQTWWAAAVHLPCRTDVGARPGPGGPSSGGSWQHGPCGSHSSRKVVVMFLLLCGGELLDANKVNGLTGDIVALATAWLCPRGFVPGRRDEGASLRWCAVSIEAVLRGVRLRRRRSWCLVSTWQGFDGGKGWSGPVLQVDGDGDLGVAVWWHG
jgi:hypothetical protein